eukprot:CAMPEP_0172192570 /NCGR_PEP_ID=MMETSP1050-20130122/24403_1 /TAXON_ID=233186 /ORGANISM="Cryptomonas curvata, Strain CCAP979/52" /LENGTH=71 /DNA_ID=CAMNT_0012867891 /DNA_START=29 /DNA_END=240 /DNA_ORIENTATION=+
MKVLKTYELQSGDAAEPLSAWRNCLVSNGRYVIRAVEQRMYVWNLESQQLTAIVQHELGGCFSAMLLHPTA